MIKNVAKTKEIENSDHLDDAGIVYEKAFWRPLVERTYSEESRWAMHAPHSRSVKFTVKVWENFFDEVQSGSNEFLEGSRVANAFVFEPHVSESWELLIEKWCVFNGQTCCAVLRAARKETDQTHSESSERETEPTQSTKPNETGGMHTNTAHWKSRPNQCDHIELHLYAQLMKPNGVL